MRADTHISNYLPLPYFTSQFTLSTPISKFNQTTEPGVSVVTHDTDKLPWLSDVYGLHLRIQVCVNKKMQFFRVDAGFIAHEVIYKNIICQVVFLELSCSTDNDTELRLAPGRVIGLGCLGTSFLSHRQLLFSAVWTSGSLRATRTSDSLLTAGSRSAPICCQHPWWYRRVGQGHKHRQSWRNPNNAGKGK